MEMRREWIDFSDANGKGLAEPDGFIVLDDEVVVFEVKLTGCRYGAEQIGGLYVPLLSHIYGRPTRGLQVCRNTGPDTPGPFIDDPVAFVTASTLPLATWHWPGR
jgi:hypothetical protein